VVALALAMAFCVHGVTWGRFEPWHPDQMVYFRFDDTGSFLLPRGFQKPPFYTYMNYFIVNFPVRVIRYLFGFPPSSGLFKMMLLIGSRLLALALFLGCIVLLYSVLRPTFGLLPARVSALLMATSSGFVTYAHFLTSDLPVTFWMLAAFAAAAQILRSPTLRAYVACGLCTGLATATKYNGLGIGIALATTHFLVWRQSGVPLIAGILDRSFIAALACVVLGFLLGNPYALLRLRDFAIDFWIVNAVTPIYTGVTSGSSYDEFLFSTAEVFGIPLALLLGIAVAYAIFWLFTSRPWTIQQRLILVTMVTVGVYYARMGAFPRWETRFALPILPLVLLLAAPLWQRLGPAPVVALTLPIMLYGAASSAYVGRALLDDPRMDAQLWFAENAPPDAHVEIGALSVFYHRIPGLEIERVWMPWISTRRRLLPDLFPDQPTVRRRWEEIEPPENLQWYSAPALSERRPDFIAVNSLFYHRFTSGTGRRLYPEIARFFQDLLCERLGYQIVFDQKSSPLPWWFYPRRIDFLENREVILAPASGSTDSAPGTEQEACDLTELQGYYAFRSVPQLEREGVAEGHHTVDLTGQTGPRVKWQVVPPVRSQLSIVDSL
jgi:hypothetical protein